MTWKFTSRANSIIDSRRRPSSSTAAIVIPRSDRGKGRKVGPHKATNKMDEYKNIYISKWYFNDRMFAFEIKSSI